MGYREEMDSLNFLQKEVKRKCMMFNVTYKEERAALWKLPLWAFYHMAYADLSSLANKESALEWWKKNKVKVAASEAYSIASTHSTDESLRDRFEALVLGDLKKQAKIKD